MNGVLNLKNNTFYSCPEGLHWTALYCALKEDNNALRMTDLNVLISYAKRYYNIIDSSITEYVYNDVCAYLLYGHTDFYYDSIRKIEKDLKAIKKRSI